MSNTKRFVAAVALLVCVGFTLAGAQPANEKDAGKDADSDGKLAIAGAMEEVSLTELIQQYSEFSGRAVLFDAEKFKAKKSNNRRSDTEEKEWRVTMHAPSEGVNVDFEDVLLSALSEFRLTMAFDGRFERVIPAAEAITMADTIKREDVADYPPMRYVRVVVSLKNADANAARGALQNLTTRQGGVVNPVAGANALIVCDTADNMLKLLDMIDELDLSNLTVSRVAKLKHVTFDEIQEAVYSSLYDLSQSNVPQGKTKLGSTSDGKTVVVTGPEVEVERIINLVVELDQPKTK